MQNEKTQNENDARRVRSENFTAGPWCVHSGARGLEIHPADDEHGENPIADVLTSEADARVLAAAPELLAALEKILNDCPEAGENAVLSVDGYNKACAAIAKAKGGPQ